MNSSFNRYAYWGLAKMTFLKPLNIGNIELHWIDSHEEEIIIQGKRKKLEA